MSGHFTSQNLPPLVPESDGIAHPKPAAEVVVCRVPERSLIKTPWGQELDAPVGTAHIAQDGVGDSYPNLEFDIFYEETGDAPEDDPRTVYLRNFWAERGHTDLSFQLAKKTKPAIVVGAVAEEAYGATFENHEGTTPLEAGLILQSPKDEGVRWFIRQGVFEKKYQGVMKS